MDALHWTRWVVCPYWGVIRGPIVKELVNRMVGASRIDLGSGSSLPDQGVGRGENESRCGKLIQADWPVKAWSRIGWSSAVCPHHYDLHNIKICWKSGISVNEKLFVMSLKENIWANVHVIHGLIQWEIGYMYKSPCGKIKKVNLTMMKRRSLKLFISKQVLLKRQVICKYITRNTHALCAYARVVIGGLDNWTHMCGLPTYMNNVCQQLC